MLNLLISILGDSYERIQLNLIESDYSQMLEIIIEIENLMVWNRNRGSPVYLQQCKLAEDEENDVEWEGRIRALHDKVLSVKDLIDVKFNTVDLKLQGIQEIQKNMEDSQKNSLKSIEDRLAENQKYNLKCIEDQFKSMEETILKEIHDKLARFTN